MEMVNGMADNPFREVSMVLVFEVGPWVYVGEDSLQLRIFSHFVAIIICCHLVTEICSIEASMAFLCTIDNYVI